jgi:hypothetical protein
MARLKVTDTPVLWAGLLAGPLAWVVHLQGAFALSAYFTEQENFAPLHVLSVVCLLVAVGGLVLSRRGWGTVRGLPSGTEGPDTARVRYLTFVGMMTGVLFTCVIVAQWIAVMLLPHRMGAA